MTINYIETMKQARGALVQCQQQLSSDWTHFTTATEAITNLTAAIDAAEKQEPAAWVRRHPDGALTAEFLEHEVIEPVRKKSGAWVPLYAYPAPTQPDSEQVYKDAARLDWVIRNEVQVWEVNGRYSVREVTEASTITSEYPTARAAIDAAMKAGANTTGETK